MGYANAHPRLNPVGILPPGSRPSDVHPDDGIIVGRVLPVGAHRIRPNPSHRYREDAYNDVVAMTCEACDAETQARHIARGKRSATPGIRHPHPPASV